MFKFIHDRQELFQEAALFVVDKMPDVEVTTDAVTRSVSVMDDDFPCLVDMLVNHNWSRQKVFSAHVCSKGTAKCLVYPKTNKPRGISWFIVHNANDIPGVIHKSRYFGGNSELIMTPGFDKEMEKVGRGELFLINVKTLIGNGRAEPNKMHVSMVTLAEAKRLVYYKKNTIKSEKLSKLVWDKKYRFKLIRD